MRAPVLAAALLVALSVAGPAQQAPPARPPAVDSALKRTDSLVTARADSLRRLRGDSAAPRAQRPDSIRPRPPISPGGAFLRSLLVPGWGQAGLGRHLTGALFVAFEGTALMMAWKSEWHLDFARQAGKTGVTAAREREDWYVLLAFNHLFAAAEAYVAAHLWDFPVGLRARALPGGSTGVGVTLPLR
jgi:hypothetical protein